MTWETEPRVVIPEVGERPVVISYQSRMAWMAPGIIVFMLPVGVIWMYLAIIQNGPVWFGLLWFGVLGWNGYNMIVRQARSIVVAGGNLVWRGWLRTESVAKQEVARLTLAQGGAEQVIELRDGRKLRVAIGQGYRSFLERLGRAYPDLPIEIGWYSRFADGFGLFRPRSR